MGELESPRWWRLERADPEKHVVLLSLDVLSEPSFFGRLRERIDMSPQRSALVFIHGYNVSFEDAARRTGQLAYDLNFQGAPILYSWPSQASYWRYPMDATYAERTVPYMERFLADVALRSGADTIHVIAHSLGNRPLINALARIADQKGSGGKPLFNEIILTAPDIDADVFVDLAARIAGVGERVTLYASGKDGALNFSKWFNGLPRAGDTSEGVVIVEGVDTIDASSVDTSLMGHSYFGDNRSVISDIYWTIKAKSVSERHGIRPSIFREQRYWLFQP
jgi:esterase/lipase superfamily enzyme